MRRQLWGRCVAGIGVATWLLHAVTPLAQTTLPRSALGLKLSEPFQVGQFRLGKVRDWWTVPAITKQSLIPDVIDAYKDYITSSRPTREIPEDRPDNPGSVTVIVAQFAGQVVLGIAYEMNPRLWGRMPLEKADALLTERYGPPHIRGDVRESVLPMPYGGHKVTVSRAWEWTDGVVTLRISGGGDKLNNVYNYHLYLEDVRLSAEAARLTKQAVAEAESERQRKEQESQRSRIRSLPQ